MAKKVQAHESSTIKMNTFDGGLNTDTQPLNTPANVLTDCINGTLVSHRGNNFTLQNDVGNIATNGIISKGYVPLAMKEKNGVLYILSCNKEGKTEIGTYPSYQSTLYDLDINLDDFDNFINIELEDNAEYVFDYDNNTIINSNGLVVLRSRSYNKTYSKTNVAVSMPEIPDFVSVKYTLVENENNVSTMKIASSIPSNSHYISIQDTANILCEMNTISFEHKITSAKYWLDGDKLRGLINFNVGKYNKFSNCEIYIDIIDENNILKQSMPCDYINEQYCKECTIEFPIESDIVKFKTKLRIHHRDANIDISYNTINNEVNINEVSNQQAFNLYYYYEISDDKVNVYFDLNDNIYSSNIQYTIYSPNKNEDGKIKFDEIIIEESLRRKIDPYQYIYTTSIPFNDVFKKDHIYVFELSDATTGRVIGKKLLISSNAFNSQKSIGLSTFDVSTLTPDMWLKNYSFDESAVVNYTIGGLTLESNATDLEYRKYVSAYVVNESKDGLDMSNVDARNEFIAKYQPYVYKNAVDSEYLPFIKLGTKYNANINFDEKEGIWKNIYGTRTITVDGLTGTMIIENDKTSGSLFGVSGVKYGVDSTLVDDVNKPISWRNYLIDDKTAYDWVEYKCSLNEHFLPNKNDYKRYGVTLDIDSDKINGWFGLKWLSQWIYWEFCDDDGNSIESEIFDNKHLSLDITEWCRDEIAIVGEDIDYEESFDPDNTAWGDSSGHSCAYTYLNPNTKPYIFVPIKISFNNKFLNLYRNNIKFDANGEATVLGLMMITKKADDEGLGLTLVPIIVNGKKHYLFENSINNENLITDTIKFWYSHMYKKDTSNFILEAKSIPDTLSVSNENMFKPNVGTSVCTITALSDNSEINPNELIKGLESIGVSAKNLIFENSINVSTNINLTNIDALDEFDNMSDFSNKIKTEFEEFIIALRSKINILNKSNKSTSIIDTDFEDILYDEKYNIKTIDESDYNFGTRPLIINQLDNKYYVEDSSTGYYTFKIVDINPSVPVFSDPKHASDIDLFRYTERALKYTPVNECLSIYRKTQTFDEYKKLFNYENNK